jgi:hypothetical protein
MAALTVTSSTAHGTVLPAAQAVSASDTFVNNGRTLIEVNNGGGSSTTVTFVTSGVYGLGTISYDVADDAQTVTNGTSKVFGPFDTTLLGTTVTVTFSPTTSVTARVIALGLY